LTKMQPPKQARHSANAKQTPEKLTVQTIPKEASEAFARMGGSVDTAFNLVLLRETIPTVWVPGIEEDGQDQRMRAVMVALRGFKPRDEIEGLLAGQAVALHFGAMECLRRAMIPEQPSEIASKLRRDGANLTRAMAEMVDALERKRGRGPQVVRVERVVVQEGGQAIVGNVSAGTAAAPPPAATEAAPAGPSLDLSPAAVPEMAPREGRREG
jgi:hypothetical protein